MDATQKAQYTRKYGISPIFRATNTAQIAASGSWAYNFEISAPASVKYFPLNFLKVANASASEILLTINGDKDAIDFIPPNTTNIYNYESIPAFRGIQLDSQDAVNVIAANKINILGQRTPITTQDMAQDIHEMLTLFKGLKGVAAKPKKAFR